MPMFARGRDTTVLTLVILVLLLAPFAFGGINQTQALLEKTFLSPVLFYFNYFARLAIALAVMLWLINVIVAKEIRFARTPLDIPIGLFVAYTLLWYIFSKSRRLAGGDLANILSCTALYYLVVNNVRTKLRMGIIAGTLIFTGFVIATIGLVQCSGYFIPSSGLKLDYAINLMRPKQYWGRVGGTFVCPNHFAGYLEMVIPFALGYVLFSKIPVGRKILMAFCGIVMTAGLLLSISRGGWVAFAVSAAFLFAMATRQKKVPVAAWLIPLVAVLVGVSVVLARSAHVQERFAHSFSKEDASYLKRMHVWLDTMSLVRDHPLFGTGPGSFELAYREYRRPSVLLAIRYTHNDYLHILADYGAVGLAILLSGVAAFGGRMWRAARKLKRRNDKALAYGVLAAVIALLVHSLIDFNMHIPSNAMTMAVIVGLGVAVRQYRLGAYDEWVALSGRKPKLFPPALQFGLAAVVVVATAGALYLNFKAYASSLTLHRAAERDPFREFADQDPRRKDLKAADKLYRKAASLFSPDAKPWAALAQMYLSKADETLEKGETNKFHLLLLGAREAKRDYEKAAAAIEEAIKRNSRDSRHRLILARAYAGIVYINEEYKRGSPTQYSPSLEKYVPMAETQFQNALRMDPNNGVYHEHLGFFYYKVGRYDDAKRKVQQALEILPDTPVYLKERKHLERLLEKIRKAQEETATTASALS